MTTLEGSVTPTQSALSDELEQFLKSYKDNKGEYPYFEQILQMVTGQTRLKVDLAHLSDDHVKYLIARPNQFLEAFNDALANILRQTKPDYYEEKKAHFVVEITGFEPQPVHRLDRQQIDTFNCIIGKVHSIGEYQQSIVEVCCKCLNCSAITKGKYGRKPKKCGACGEKELEEDFESSVIQNHRFVELTLVGKDKTESISEYEDASKVWIELKGDLVDYPLTFGDVLIVSGTVKITANKDRQPIQEIIAATLYIDANGIANYHNTDNKQDLELTAKDVQELEAFPEKYGENLISELIKAHSPRVHGEEYITESLLYQLTGAEINGSSERADIHILHIADAGTAKTERSKRHAKLANGLYQSAEGVSGVGISAGVEKDEKLGRYVARAGMAVLGNNKVKSLDEVDKLRPEFLKQLYTILESGEYQLSKIVRKTFDAKGPWYVTGNARFGKYDPNKNLIENIDFPAPLLSRFDLIWAPRTDYNRERTRQILAKINARYGIGQKSADKPAISDEQFIKYTKLAKSIKDIHITEEAFEAIANYYEQLTALDTSGLAIQPRLYQAMLRIAIARAKIHLRRKVTLEDASRAVELMQMSIKQTCIDVSTGQIDTGMLYGKTQSDITKTKMFEMIFKELSGSFNSPVDEMFLVPELVKTQKFTDENDAKQFIAKMVKDGMIYERNKGSYAKA